MARGIRRRIRSLLQSRSDVQEAASCARALAGIIGGAPHRELADAAKISQQFRFSDLQMILKESQMDIWHQVKDEVTLDLKLARHRASSDARIIQETFIRTAQLV